MNKISEKRKKELNEFLLSNIPKSSNIQKNQFSIITKNIPVLPIITSFKEKKEISSNSFFISNNTIILLSSYFNDKNNKEHFSTYIKFPEIKKSYQILKNCDIDIERFIIENNIITNKISIIKFINEEFLFDTFIEINVNLNISSQEKFILDNSKEESIGIKNNEILSFDNFNPGSPIVVKKNNKIYLVGIIDEENIIVIFKRKLNKFK